MVAFKAHFDGKVIIPDQPINLAPNQRLIVHVEADAPAAADFRTWLGLGNLAPQNPSPKFNSDDSLWE